MKHSVTCIYDTPVTCIYETLCNLYVCRQPANVFQKHLHSRVGYLPVCLGATVMHYRISVVLWFAEMDANVIKGAMPWVQFTHMPESIL